MASQTMLITPEQELVSILSALAGRPITLEKCEDLMVRCNKSMSDAVDAFEQEFRSSATTNTSPTIIDVEEEYADDDDDDDDDVYHRNYQEGQEEEPALEHEQARVDEGDPLDQLTHSPPRRSFVPPIRIQANQKIDFQYAGKWFPGMALDNMLIMINSDVHHYPVIGIDWAADSKGVQVPSTRLRKFGLMKDEYFMYQPPIKWIDNILPQSEDAPLFQEREAQYENEGENDKSERREENTERMELDQGEDDSFLLLASTNIKVQSFCDCHSPEFLESLLNDPAVPEGDKKFRSLQYWLSKRSPYIKVGLRAKQCGRALATHYTMRDFLQTTAMQKQIYWRLYMKYGLTCHHFPKQLPLEFLLRERCDAPTGKKLAFYTWQEHQLNVGHNEKEMGRTTPFMTHFFKKPFKPQQQEEEDDHQLDWVSLVAPSIEDKHPRDVSLLNGNHNLDAIARRYEGLERHHPIRKEIREKISRKKASREENQTGDDSDSDTVGDMSGRRHPEANELSRIVRFRQETREIVTFLRYRLSRKDIEREIREMFPYVYTYELELTFYIHPGASKTRSAITQSMRNHPLNDLMSVLFPNETLLQQSINQAKSHSLFHVSQVNSGNLMSQFDADQTGQPKYVWSERGTDSNLVNFNEVQLSRDCQLSVVLRDYQAQAVEFMKTAEENLTNESIWIRLALANGKLFYYSPFVKGFHFSPLPNVAGGVNAQAMGVGKTIVTIALINALPLTTEIAKPPGMPYMPSKATLIVVPASLIGQWMTELQTKSNKALRILNYTDSNRHKKAFNEKDEYTAFGDYDVVITTYGVLGSEWSAAERKKNDARQQTPWIYQGAHAPDYKSLLHRAYWHRVVLDECHTIRNPSTVSASSCFALAAKRRWMMSGTPLPTNLMDLKYVTRFLQIKGLNALFWGNVERVFVKRQAFSDDFTCSEQLPATKKFRLVRTILNLCSYTMIRHSRDQPFNGRQTLLQLPQKLVRLCSFEMSQEQRHIYDLMFAHAKARYLRFKEQGVAVSRCIECVQMLLTTRQAMSWALLVEAEVNARIAEQQQHDHVRLVEDQARQTLAGAFDPKKLPIAKVTAFQALDSDCSICLDKLDEPLQTHCLHLFCTLCIRTYLDTIRHKACPLCRQAIQASDLCRPKFTEEEQPDQQEIASEKIKSQDEDGEDQDEQKQSMALRSNGMVEFNGKVKYIIEQLCKLKRNQESKEKVLVFTQFPQSISKLKREFKANGIDFSSIEGSMTVGARKRNVERFQTDPKCLAFILSTRAGAVGLTLTAASKVFLMDACLNPALESQAIGRVLRLGQDRDVEVIHLIMEKSVEENILQVCRYKLGKEDDQQPQATGNSKNGRKRARPLPDFTLESSSIIPEVQSKTMRLEELDYLFGIKHSLRGGPFASTERIRAQ